MAQGREAPRREEEEPQTRWAAAAGEALAEQHQAEVQQLAGELQHLDEEQQLMEEQRLAPEPPAAIVPRSIPAEVDGGTGDRTPGEASSATAPPGVPQTATSPAPMGPTYKTVSGGIRCSACFAPVSTGDGSDHDCHHECDILQYGPPARHHVVAGLPSAMPRGGAEKS